MLLLLGPDHSFCESWISRAENWVDELQWSEAWLEATAPPVRMEKAAGLQAAGSPSLPFWRSERIRRISCCSYLGMNGYSVGSRPFSMHGACCLSSARPRGTLQKPLCSNYPYGWSLNWPSLIHLLQLLIHDTNVTLTWRRKSIA